MSVERIKARLSELLEGVDVDDLYREFCASSPDADPGADAFVTHLSSSGLIGGEAVLDLHARAELEVTDFGQLSPHMSQTLGFLDDMLGTDMTVASENEPDFEGAPTPSLRVDQGRYDVLGVVGEGGMGVVHVAKDLDLRRRVAFKRLPTHHAQKRLRSRRFLNEVQITAQLDHPNVVPVYSFDVAEDGSPAYTMKLVKGRTLRAVIDEAMARLKAGQPPLEDNGLDDRLEIFIKICDAMAYAHEKGVIHRDLKPANVMIGEFGEVYVMDWGLARVANDPTDDAVEAMDSVELDAVDDAAARTRTGAIVGTPKYMAPEQARGDLQNLGAWTDIYAMGLMLYELSLLQEPYGERNPLAIIVAAERGGRDPTWSPHVRISQDLAAIIDRATQPELTRRYPTARELGADLRRFRAGEQTEALPDNTLRAVRRWFVGHPRAVAAILLAVLLGSAALVAWNYYSDQVRQAAERHAAAEREQALTHFLGVVTGQAQRIDNHFLFYEAALEGLASNAQLVLRTDLMSREPSYGLSRFENKPYPPGTIDSVVYGRPVNPDHGVYIVPPDTPASAWMPDVAKLNNLRPIFFDMFRLNPDGTIAPPDPETRRNRIVHEGTPILWAYVALDDTGVIYMYPGADGFDYGYDPRVRPWYKFGQETHEKSGRRRDWSKPYVDLMGMGRVISALQPLVDDDGKFLGNAVLDLLLDYVVDNYMIADIDGFEGAWLVDRDGIVIMRTRQGADPFSSTPTEGDVNTTIDFGPFKQGDVLDSIQQGGSGHVRVAATDADPELVLGWARLQHLGWTYVVAMDARALD